MRTLLDADFLRGRYALIHVNTNNVGKSCIRRVLSTMSSLVQYAAKLQRHRPDLVYLTVSRSKFGAIKDCIIMGVAYAKAVPVVAHVRGGDLSLFYKQLRGVWRELVRWSYRRLSFGIVLGESLRSQFAGLLPAQRVRVVLNCWFDEDGEVVPVHVERGTGGPLRISFLSNVLPSKGLADALEGVSLAIRQGVKVEFRFAGEFLDHDGAVAKLPELVHENVSARTLQERYEQKVRSLGLQAHVKRLGTVTGRRKWELLADTDILLLPIYNPTEGQPLAVIEAMRAGSAVISTRCGGLVDIVEDGVTGKVVPPKNPKAIADAIKWFWDHPDELQEISAANRRRAEELHSPREHIRKIQDIFDRTISGNGHRTRREAK